MSNRPGLAPRYWIERPDSAELHAAIVGTDGSVCLADETLSKRTGLVASHMAECDWTTPTAFDRFIREPGRCMRGVTSDRERA